jgi:hypothetical protein
LKNFLWSLQMAALFVVLTTGLANAQFPVRPTEYVAGCSGGYVNPPAAYDDNTSTYSYASVLQQIKGSITACETWYGFPSRSGTNMILNVTSAAQITGTPGKSGGEVWLEYSLDGGNSFTPMYTLVNSGQILEETSSVSLPSNQDLAKIQVYARCWASVGYMGYPTWCIQQVYEIWVSGS